MPDLSDHLLTEPPEPRITECPRSSGRCSNCRHRRICTIYAEDARCNAADAAYDARKEDGL
jgi:hypothetical protein